MLDNEQLIEGTTIIGANTSLWDHNPMLKSLNKQVFRGRVFLEVWEDDARLVVNGNEPLIRETLSILEKRTYELVEKNALPSSSRGKSLTNEPATGGEVVLLSSQSKSAYIGRVIVELWDKDNQVMVEGDRDLLLEKTIQMLKNRKL